MSEVLCGENILIWRKNILAKSNIIELEWDSLLIPEDLSSEEEKSHSAVVTKHLSNLLTNQSSDSEELNNITEITVDDSLLESQELELNTISNDELFNYFQEEKVEIHPNILFPKIKRVNVLFWFLHNLGQLDINESNIVVNNSKELSMNYYLLVEAALFFGFLDRTVEDREIYLIPTNFYENFINQPLEQQYPLFLASLGRNETVSEVLQVQLNDPIFDNISRQMVHNILANDPNIKNESLSVDEIKKITNNFRYWYLGIKKAILEN